MENRVVLYVSFKPMPVNSNVRILVVEDSDLDAELIERELRQGGIKFISNRVQTRAAFVSALKTFQPELILTDYRLPDFDGAQALAMAKEACPDVPGIVISGAVGEETAVELLRNGATDFVLKDRLGRLIPSVHRALREVAEHKARQQAEAALADSQAALQVANETLRESNEELERRVAARTAQLSALATELTLVEERERLRLADTLHEGLLQELAAAKCQLALMEGQLAKENSAVDFGELYRYLNEAIQLGRTLNHELYPPALHTLGLGSTIQWLGQWFHDKYGLSVEVEATPEFDVAKEELRIVLFRIAKELLLNVHKHARVGRACVSLRLDPGGKICMEVRDNGIGFDPVAVRAREGLGGGFGLFSLRERIESLGGSVEVLSAPGSGSRFIVTIATAAYP